MGRPRKRQPVISTAEATLEWWQSDSKLVRWAQNDPNFRAAVAVVTSERSRALNHVAQTASENRRLGIVEGFELALEVLREMSKDFIPQPVEPAMTYESDEPVITPYG